MRDGLDIAMQRWLGIEHARHKGQEAFAFENIPLQEGTMPNPPVEGTIDMGGGLPIMVGKDVIGAIAVSGAPGWPMDEACAKAGLEKVADKLK